MTDTLSSVSRPPNADVQQNQNTQSQADAAKKAQDAAQQVQKNQAAHEAQKASGLHASQLESPALGLPQEFMGVLDSIVREGYQTAKPTQEGKLGDQSQEGFSNQNDFAQDLHKDTQVVKEFIKEAKYMIENQGLQIAQVFNMIKVEQGGMFWQKVQAILQKGIPGDAAASAAGKMDAATQEGLKKAQEMDAAFKAMAGGTAGAEAMKTPGKAILELLRAEINPQGQVDSFLAAMKILNRDGMQESAQRLRSYLRHRGGMPEEAIGYFWEKKKDETFPVPLFNREEIKPVNWWYILMALGSFGISMGLGLNIWEAFLVGIGLVAMMFFLSYVFKGIKR